MLLKEMGVPLYQPSVLVQGVLLKHGHEDLTAEESSATHVLMGHEHPVVAVKDDVGIMHRYKAFLTGRVDRRTVTVLTSVSPLAHGSDVNQIAPSQLLSPLLRGRSLDDFVPYLVDVGVSLKKFPKLGDL